MQTPKMKKLGLPREVGLFLCFDGIGFRVVCDELPHEFRTDGAGVVPCVIA